MTSAARTAAPLLQTPIQLAVHSHSAKDGPHTSLCSSRACNTTRSHVALGDVVRVRGAGVRRRRGLLACVEQGLAITLLDVQTQTPVHTYTLAPSDRACTPPLVVERQGGEAWVRTTYVAFADADAGADASVLWALTEHLDASGRAVPGAAADKRTWRLAGAVEALYALPSGDLLAVRAGGVNLLIPNPRDMVGFIKELSKYQVNSFPAVNTLYNGLLNTPGFDKLDFSKLKTSFGGGMATQKPVAEKWLKVTGCALSEGYGLSETSPTLTCNPADADEFSGSIGLPVPSTHLSIRDDDGNELPIGQAGEICAKGPQVMAGYWNRPDETARVMTADGYFRTGDIGVMDARGYTKIVDRKKDMILVSGFNVYPNEIEEVIASHPGVLECAVIGVPDAKSGEAVKAFVVKKDPNVSAEDIIKFSATQLTAYKVPKQIEFRTDLPKTNVGKILRRELRDEKKAAA